MFLQRTGKARRGDLIVLHVWIRGLDVVMDAVSPDQLRRTLNALRALCKAHARRTGGSLAVAAVGVDHAFFVCAWIDGHRRTRLHVPTMVRGVATDLRESLTRTVPDHAEKATVEVAAAVGECVYVQTGKRLSDPEGAGVQRLLSMSRLGPKGRDVILVDDSVKDRFQDEDLKDLGDGVSAVVS